jgi:hypothetical protein
MSRSPTQTDAQLVLTLYDLRRETVMRQHRALFLREFWPTRAEDVAEVVRSDHPLNVAYRQVTTYWEMAFALCRHGTLDPELLLDSSAEGMFIYARIQPYLTELRTAAMNPRVLRNTEWVASHTEIGQTIFGIQRERVLRLLKARAEAAAR